LGIMARITYVTLGPQPHVGHLDLLRVMRRLGHDVRVITLRRPVGRITGDVLITEGVRPTAIGKLLAVTHRCWSAIAASPSILNPTVNALYSTPDLVIAVSSLVKDLIPNKTLILHPRPPELDALLKFPIDSKMPWVCYNGVFIPIKGVHKIPEIAREVTGELHGEVKFILAGGSQRDPLGSYIIKKAHEYGISDNIKLIGRLPRSEILKVLSKCSVYIQPSLFDAFSIAVVEAMALGSVPVVTKYVGSSEIITKVDANLVTDLNPKSMAKIIIELLNNNSLLRDLGRSVRKVIGEYLSESNIVKQVSSLITQCLE